MNGIHCLPIMVMASLALSDTDRDGVRALARQLLEESGWVDDVRALCREHLVQCEDPGAIPSESLAAAILDTARQRVPDGVKASLLTELCDALSSPGPPRPEPPSAS
ncbi:hypothetical protein H632_c2606p1 [Helicosporidium sp. ATCC 50920]|nr:hypothetical protein H632_c2606p1 [Helicosporidium sp. ATCC 50920]|eukprot:KDD73036.1 hypothetical protein H632_c2606p1 [Helicosporidium sp. ATCC 50920]